MFGAIRGAINELNKCTGGACLRLFLIPKNIILETQAGEGKPRHYNPEIEESNYGGTGGAGPHLFLRPNNIILELCLDESHQYTSFASAFTFQITLQKISI